MLSRSSIYWAYIDQVLKTLTSKEDIPKLVEGLGKWSKPVDQISGFKVLKLEEKVGENNFTIKSFEDKVRSLEDEQMFLNKQDDLRCRKMDDLEQYGGRESLCFDGFEVSDAEPSADCGKIVKII